MTARVDVFFDSSVLFAAAYSSRGYARDLLVAATRGSLSFALTELVLDETERNLANNAPKALVTFRELLPIIAPHVSPSPSKRLIIRVAEVVHLKDAPIVAGAMRARARFLASYDRRHLLNERQAIQQAFDISVATPEEILRSLNIMPEQ